MDYEKQFEDRVREYCKEKKFKLIRIIKGKTKSIKSNSIKVKCKNGHRFEKAYRAVIDKVGCIKCHYESKIKDTSDIKEIVKKKGWKCLSKDFKGSKNKKYKFKCSKGHIFYKTYNNAKIQGCLECKYIEHSKNLTGKYKYTLKEIQTFAKKKGGKFLSKSLGKTSEKGKWKCKEGHIWKADVDSVINKKTWCHQCVVEFREYNKKKTLKDCKALAKKRGFKLLSKEYKHSKAPLEWKCKNKDHDSWVTTFSAIQTGSNCPECAYENHKFKREEEIRKIFERVFKTKFPKARPKWLLNPITGYRMELDGYNKKLKIAFECQGEQHYEDTYFNQFPNASLKVIKKRDKAKKIICKTNNIRLIPIKFDRELTYIESQLKLFKYKLAA